MAPAGPGADVARVHDILRAAPTLRAILLAFALVTAVALVAVNLGFHLAYDGRIAAGVRVAGIDVGGRTQDDAARLLGAHLETVAAEPVTLRMDSLEWQLTAADLGVEVDLPTLVAEAYAVGREGNPLQQLAGRWFSLVFGRQFDRPALAVAPENLHRELARIAHDVDRPARDARIELAPSTGGIVPQIVPEEVGVQLDVAASAERVRDALMGELPVSVDLMFEVAHPSATTADFHRAREQAEAALAGPLTLTFQERRWTIPPEILAAALVFTREPGAPASMSVDPAALSRTVESIGKELEQPPLNARFEWTGSTVRPIRESQEGRALDADALKSRIRAALLGGDRTVVVPVLSTRPAITTADGPSLRVKDLIKEGRTTFAGSVPEKQHNIRLAASRLNGTVVPPGGLFSFNREVGPTTIDAGFRTGWGITLSGAGARTVPSVAGGICQVATTLFQPVFHAGYAIEQRNWHLYWIQSYGQPPLGMRGLDATVDEDYGVDFQFVNTTPDPLLIHARVEGTTLIFRLYGTKPNWDVRIEGPTITNVVPADRAVVRQAEPSMPTGRELQVEAAQDGFDVTIVRTVVQGDDVRTLRLRSHYLPARNVVLYGTGQATAT